MSNDDETAAMRARAEAFMRPHTGVDDRRGWLIEYLVGFGIAEVARALAEERSKVAGNKCHAEYKPDEITFLCSLPKGHRFDHANMFKQWSLTAEEQEALPCLCAGAVSLKNCPRHRPRRQQRLDASTAPLASTGMASAGPPVCKVCDGTGREKHPGEEYRGWRYCGCATGRELVRKEIPDLSLPNLSPGLKTYDEFRAAVVAGARAAAEPSGDSGRLPAGAFPAPLVCGVTGCSRCEPAGSLDLRSQAILAVHLEFQGVPVGAPSCASVPFPLHGRTSHSYACQAAVDAAVNVAKRAIDVQCRRNAELVSAVGSLSKENPPHECSCSNDPCPKCGGHGPEGEWSEGDEVKCTDCGVELVVSYVQTCRGRSGFESANDGEPTEEVPPADRAALMADTDAEAPPAFRHCACGYMATVGGPCTKCGRGEPMIPPNEAAGNVPAPAASKDKTHPHVSAILDVLCAQPEASLKQRFDALAQDICDGAQTRRMVGDLRTIEELVTLAEAERDALKARVAELESALKQADEACVRWEIDAASTRSEMNARLAELEADKRMIAGNRDGAIASWRVCEDEIARLTAHMEDIQITQEATRRMNAYSLRTERDAAIAEKAAAVRDMAVLRGLREGYKANLEDELAVNAAIRERFGARDTETMEMFVGRLVTERDAAIAEKAAAVLAERERCLGWIVGCSTIDLIFEGIHRGEAAPK